MIPGEDGEEQPEFEPHCYHCQYFDENWCVKQDIPTSAADTCEHFDTGEISPSI